MNGIITVLTDNILPIFVVAGLGVLLRRFTRLDTQALSRLALYALSPCLFYSSLANSELQGGEVGQIVAFTLLTTLAMGALALLAGIALRLRRSERTALLLLAIFTNCGNFGLTLNQLRYGDPGLSRAVIYFTVSTILIFTLGVFLASAGRAGLREGLRRLVRMPTTYAVILAVVAYNTSFELPAALDRGVAIAGDGAIPVMLVVLGMQMADLRSLSELRVSSFGALVRLVAGPLVAVGVAGLLGLTGLAHSVSIIQASLPTAVFTTILATEFDVLPSAVTTGVVLSTLLSPITLALTINLFAL